MCNIVVPTPLTLSLLTLSSDSPSLSLPLFTVCVWLQDFSISFEFSENEWFSDKVLTMTYQVKCEVDEDDPWVFEGATIRNCKG